MELIEGIRTRKSVKKYLDKPVPNDLIGAVVESGSMAPSSGNKQNWKFVVVKNPTTQDQIAKHCNEQYWMASAPVFIVVCSDDDTIVRFYGNRGKTVYSIQNCAAAMQNMLLAAHSLGLGSCWVSEFDEVELANDIGLSSGARVQAILTLGYPTKEVHKKTFRPLKNIMFLESYGGGIKSFAPFMYDWSSIAEEHAKDVSDDLKKVLKSEFKEFSTEIDKRWSKIFKKISAWFRRKY
ncbi:MAG: nitroreductase family protein [Nanoarchaeota archaeon]